MDMFEAYRTCIKNYATFRGRARRREYWLFILCNDLVFLVLYCAQYLAQQQQSGTLMYVVTALMSVYSLFIFLPGLAVTVRRLHDTGHSGWFYFVAFIPVVGWIILLVMLCKDSAPGSNEYGPNPKEITGFSSEVPPIEPLVPDPVSAFNNDTPGTVKVNYNNVETVSLKAVVKATCIQGPIPGKSATGEVLYIGRDRNLCQLVFPENTPGVSGVHCMLHSNGYTLEVSDLNSTYGTYLSDGTKLEPNKLVYLSDGKTTMASQERSVIYLGSQKVAVSVELVLPR